MSYDLIENIEFELGQLHQLFDEGRDLIDSSIGNPPDATGRWALGAMLQAFYNGIENIFKQISKAYDGKPVKTERWHVDLITLMSQTTKERPLVISPELYATLRKYLGFRHIFRGIYTHELRWESMVDLVAHADSSLMLLEKEIRVFLEWSKKNPSAIAE